MRHRHQEPGILKWYILEANTAALTVGEAQALTTWNLTG